MQRADSQSIHNNARQMMPASRLQCREIFEGNFHFVIESDAEQRRRVSEKSYAEALKKQQSKQ